MMALTGWGSSRFTFCELRYASTLGGPRPKRRKRLSQKARIEIAVARTRTGQAPDPSFARARANGTREAAGGRYMSISTSRVSASLPGPYFCLTKASSTVLWRCLTLAFFFPFFFFFPSSFFLRCSSRFSLICLDPAPTHPAQDEARQGLLVLACYAYL
ncbi:hypothetical protein LY76DRAFT_163783 [Colletotrichum caudatum]|nr:hypothetical protein LY76DRAFT_163783 [Colletotrichum caudatum]